MPTLNWTGGAFDYYELDAPLFQEDGNLNEEVGEDKIREYIFFSETQGNRVNGENRCAIVLRYNGIQIVLQFCIKSYLRLFVDYFLYDGRRDSVHGSEYYRFFFLRFCIAVL